MTKITIGKKAPLFDLPEKGSARHSLADHLKNGPTVVAFFKVSCPVCQFSLPFLERLYEAYDSQRTSFLGISQDDAADTQDFCRAYNLKFPILIDGPGYPVSNLYGLTNVPTILLVAPEGTVKVSGTGFSKNDMEAISAELGRHVGASPVPVFRPGEVVPEYQPG